MRAVALYFLLLVFPFAVLAENEKIEGGFGIDLGQKIEEKNLPQDLAMARLDENNDEVIYSFTPQHPYEPLSEYRVYVTPRSGRVYRIEAEGYFRKRESCVEELELLEDILTRKYGKKNHDAGVRFTDLDVINFGGKNRKIIVKCSGYFTKHKLKLSYVDRNLMKDAKQEAKKPHKRDGREADNAEERDARGL